MSWLRRSRPAYAVDGVESQLIDGWDVFDGDALAGPPAVTEAAARLPQDPALEDLPGYLAVCTKSTGLLTADVVLAQCVDVCGEVFRRLGGLVAGLQPLNGAPGGPPWPEVRTDSGLRTGSGR